MIGSRKGTHTERTAYALPHLPKQDRPEEIHVGSDTDADRTSDFSPPVDVLSSDDRLTVTLEAPGADQESLSVTIKNGMLTLQGYKPPLGPAGHGSSPYTGSNFGRFREQINLPREARTDDTRAAYERGLLSVIVPLADSHGFSSIPIRQS